MRLLPVIALALVVAACGGTDDQSADDENGPTTAAPPSSTTAVPTTQATATTEASVPETTSTQSPPSGSDVCADVIDVEVREGGDGFTFAVTVRSPDTGWEKYADAWQVWAPDGSVLGERILTHPHVDEQPFTRSQSGIVIPDDVTVVTVAARDSIEGFCGETLEIAVPGRG